MFFWIIRQILISFILIFVLHNIYNYFKNNLTVPKIKDLIKKPAQQYKELYETEYRGGSQGDYSSEMIHKIENVVDSLVNFHNSKRAVVMMNNQWWSHDDTDEAKCLREIHFRLERDDNHYKLCSTGIFRAQAVDIMPKKQNKQVQRYIKTLDKDSLRAYEIAQGQLETSFNIQKSIGFF